MLLVNMLYTYCCFAFNFIKSQYVCNALTPMIGHQEDHPACKKLSDDVLPWLYIYCQSTVTSEIMKHAVLVLPRKLRYIRIRPLLFTFYFYLY